VVAYGLADAEHLVEKEIRQRLPDATVEVTGIERVPGSGQIAEEFRAEYCVRAAVEAEGEDAASARRAALVHMRERLAGSRYQRIEWEK
jgi:hypothetical protein